jgi:2-dehydropantoate 2-reductase
MKITVVGAGAIGGVIGAYLIKEGNELTLCDRNEDHVEHINRKGLQIDGPIKSFVVSAKAVTPKELLSEKESIEVLFLCVKAQHTVEALKPLIPLLTKDSIVVSFQNGLNELTIAELIGEERTIGCFVNFSADYLEPGKILYGGVASLYLGELDGSITSRLISLQEMVTAWGPVEITNNIWGFLWGKLSYAGLLFATALVDETMASVVRNLKYRETLLELCSEILELADKEGVTPLGFDGWRPELIYPRGNRDNVILNEAFEGLAQLMASNKKTKSGIWRDLAVHKRKTEIDAQLVPLLEIAKKHHLKMPLTCKLIKQIKELEDGTRKMSEKNLQELKDQYVLGVL